MSEAPAKEERSGGKGSKRKKKVSGDTKREEKDWKLPKKNFKELPS